MSSPEHPKLDRIRKLLETAESFSEKPDAASQATAENYRERAYALAAQYEIDRALLRVKRVTNEKPIGTSFLTARPFVQQKVLASIVFRAFGCSLVDTGSRKGALRGRVHAVGYEADLDQAQMLFASLVIQASRESVVRYRQYLAEFEPWTCAECESTVWKAVRGEPGWYYCAECEDEFHSSSEPAGAPERRSTWYRSFWVGWVNALGPRISKAHDEVQQQAEAVEPGTAIALRSRDLAVQEKFEQLFPRTRRAPSRRSSGSGYRDGFQAGSQADIGTGKLGASRKELK